MISIFSVLFYKYTNIFYISKYFLNFFVAGPGVEPSISQVMSLEWFSVSLTRSVSISFYNNLNKSCLESFSV